MRNGIGTLQLAGVLACLCIPGCSRVAAKTEDASAPAVPIRAARAITANVPLELTAVGNVEAINSVDVKSRIAGPIATVAFEEGQNVAKGQLLFTIDRETLNRQAVEQQAMTDRDTAMEAQARAILARDAASAKQSRADAEIAIKLGQLGVLAGQRVNQLTTASDTASAGMASDQAALAAAQSTLRADRARAAQTQLQQNFTRVVAPISGRAGAVLVKAGNLVRDSDTTLVTLLQLAPISVTFGIPEQALQQVQTLNARAPLSVQATAGGISHTDGRVSFVDNTVDTMTGTVRMKAVFPNDDRGFWPGEFVRVRVRLRTDAGRVVVPDACIQQGTDGTYAWILRDGRAAMTPVAIERVYTPQDAPAMAVIGRGIRSGDLVVTDGQLRLSEGARVAIENAGARQPVPTTPSM